MLGVESEMNTRIPLLEELVYMHYARGVDLWLHFISPATKYLEPKYTKSYQATCGDNVLDMKRGNRRVRVTLENNSNLFHDADNISFDTDAVIGHNAGIGSYYSWLYTLMMVIFCNIPFAFSADYTKNKVWHHWDWTIPYTITNWNNDANAKLFNLSFIQNSPMEISLLSTPFMVLLEMILPQF